jgi:hypothetical protein
MNTGTIWAFDLGKGSIGEAVRRGNEFKHGESLLIPAEFAETKTAAGRRRMWRTRQAHSSHRPSPAGGGIVVAASGKDFQAPCRSGMVVVRKDYAASTALGRIVLKMPIKFSTRFGNGRMQWLELGWGDC